MMQYVLVTGACGGIGSAVVEKLLAQGFGIWAVDRDEERLNSMYGNNGKVRYYRCEFESEDAVKSLMSTVKDTTGALRGLVHCAGISNFSPIVTLKKNVMLKVFDIHVFSTMFLCSLLVKNDMAEDGCSVVLLSSIACHEGTGGNCIYAAAKGAVESFVVSAAHDFYEKGIRINAIAPGDVNTGMFKKFLNKLTDEQQVQRESDYPAGFGQSEDVANFVRFLISDESKWCVGQTYILDGGHSVRKV